MLYLNCFSKPNIRLNIQRLLSKCNEYRYSFGGRLATVCVLITGLILLLWGIVLFMGIHSLATSIVAPSWVFSITSFTQNFLTSGISLLHLAILLVTIGAVIFLAMCLLLPRAQNISPEKRIIL